MPPRAPLSPSRVPVGRILVGRHRQPRRAGHDILAEVARLETLGARREQDMGSFWQMTDPAGLVFCVVGVQTGEAFERYAVSWP